MSSKVRYTLNILSFDFLNKLYYVESNVEKLYTIPDSIVVYSEKNNTEYRSSLAACNGSDFYTDTRGDYYFTLKEGEEITEKLIESFLVEMKKESCKRLRYSLDNIRRKLYEVETVPLNLKSWELDEY